MARLLIVHHSPGASLPTMLDAVRAGTEADGIDAVEVVAQTTFATTAVDVCEADGIIVGTPANLGYMSGALKHFFDTVYNDCLEHTTGMPWGMFVHGESDTTGAATSVDRVVTGLQWQKVITDVTVIGEVDEPATDRCWELGATVAARVMER